LDTGRHFVELHCVSQFYSVSINDIPLDDLVWKFHYKQSTGQRGILTYIDVTDLPRGNYELDVQIPDEMYRRGSIANIPFYREISNAGYQVMPQNKRDEEEDSYLQIKPIFPK
jgi:hypothetical protein